MHLLNLEMRIVIKLEDKLTTPMSPSIMVRDKNKNLYIIGGIA